LVVRRLVIFWEKGFLQKGVFMKRKERGVKGEWYTSWGSMRHKRLVVSQRGGEKGELFPLPEAILRVGE